MGRLTPPIEGGPMRNCLALACLLEEAIGFEHREVK